MLNRTIIFYPVKNKELQSPVIYGTNINSKIKSILTSYDELAVAKWVFINNKNAGATTNTLPKAKAWYLAKMCIRDRLITFNTSSNNLNIVIS